MCSLQHGMDLKKPPNFIHFRCHYLQMSTYSMWFYYIKLLFPKHHIFSLSFHIRQINQNCQPKFGGIFSKRSDAFTNHADLNVLSIVIVVHIKLYSILCNHCTILFDVLLPFMRFYHVQQIVGHLLHYAVTVSFNNRAWFYFKWHQFWTSIPQILRTHHCLPVGSLKEPCRLCSAGSIDYD